MTIAKELGYKRYFNVQEFLFSRMGVDFTKKPLRQPYLLVLAPFVLAVMMFSYAWKNRYDTVQITETLGTAIEMVIAFFKILFFVINQKKIQTLLQTMWTMSKTDDTEERNIIRDLNAKAYYFSNVLVIGAGIAQSLAIIARPVMISIIYWKTGDFHIIPLTLDIPYDYAELWKYALTETIYHFSTTMTAIGTLSIDTLYIWLVLNLMAQFRILNLKFRRAALLKNVNKMDGAVIDCIRSHQRIIEFAENFDLVYRPIIFGQFAMVCLPLGFCGYQITMGTNQKSVFAMYLFGDTFEISLYCFLGQRIQDESYNVSDNIYESFSWEKLSKKSKQLLLITMSRAQKCCVITGIFFVVDISLFVWVYRTTTSYITILWTLAA